MRYFLALALTAVTFGRDAGALLDAVRDDDRGAVERLLKLRANPNGRDSDGTTPLAWAVVRVNPEITAMLLKAGADPNLTNELGIGPLWLAITNDSVEIMSQLLDRGADPNMVRENGETPLMTATRQGRVDMMKLLLAKGAAVNVSDKKFGQTALMWAAGRPEAVRLLIEHGADIRTVTRTWDIKYTIYLPPTGTIGRTGIPYDNDGDYTTKKGGQNALFFAVQKNDVESTRILLDADLDVNSTAADGTTPLLAALYKWDPSTGPLGREPDTRSTAGRSQIFSPDLPLAKYLLHRGASVKAVDGAGYTPLHGAALAVAKYSQGAQRERGVYGRNAATLALGAGAASSAAALKDALALVGRLLDAGADPNQQTVYPTGGPAGDVRLNPASPGSSAMHIAAGSGSVELVRIFADHGGNPNLMRKDGHTPLSVAVIAGDLPVVKELVARGADVNGRWNPQDKIPDPVEAIARARRNQSILHLAAIGGKPEMLEYLYSKGAALDARNSMDETPLDLADKQERYREAIQRENAESDPEKLKKVVRNTAGTDMLKKLAALAAAR